MWVKLHEDIFDGGGDGDGDCVGATYFLAEFERLIGFFIGIGSSVVLHPLYKHSIH